MGLEKKTFIPKKTHLIKSKYTFRSKEEDALQPLRERGYAKMLECWQNRQSKCFWDNFWWTYFQTQYTKCQNFFPLVNDATCLSLPSGSLEKDRCESRKITSGYCYVNDDNLIVKLTSPESGDKLFCKNVPITELYKSCKTQCAKVSTDANKVEAGGCDGYTAWCWCNKTQGNVTPSNANSHCTCTDVDKSGNCLQLKCD